MGIENDISRLQDQMEDVQAQLGAIVESSSYRFKVYHSTMQESMFIGPTFTSLQEAKAELKIVIDDIKLKRALISSYEYSKKRQQQVEQDIKSSYVLQRYDSFLHFERSVFKKIQILEGNKLKEFHLHYITFSEIELIKIVAIPDDETFYKF